MKIYPAGHTPSRPGSPDWFTGRVRLDPLFDPDAPDRVQGVHVTFDPGARTAWHTHHLGQTLIVTAGLGRCQSDGGPIRTIRPGDVVTFAPGERHWHGAAPDRGMSHIAIHEVKDGRSVDWMEPVSDSDYAMPPQE
jgi:quercetin dioxygenase-like cupin family protein